MLLEEKFLEFHRYASSHNLPLEAISVGDENKVLCEMHYAANAPRNIYSHTKSFTVTAVGLAIEEGKLSLEDHVAEVFKDKLPSNPDPNLEKIQLKHLLCMSSGFGKALLMNADRRPGVGAPDYEKYMMAQPVPVEPGSAFCYSSADSILAAHMVDPWHVGYGYQFWISPYPGSYRADGAFGQITTILPEKGLVVSIQCPERGNFDQVKRALHEHFLMEL